MSDIKRFLLGSVTEAVERLANCPVLIVEIRKGISQAGKGRAFGLHKALDQISALLFRGPLSNIKSLKEFRRR